MAQGNFRASNPLVRAWKEREARSRETFEERELDEAIGLATEDELSEEEGEDVMSEAESDPNSTNAKKTPRKSTQDPDARPPDRFVNPQEVRAAIAELFTWHQELMNLVYGHRLENKSKLVNAEMFFIHQILVPPSKYRPEARTDGTEIAESPQNSHYKAILTAADRINQIRREIIGVQEATYRRRDMRDLQIAWVALQDSVNALIDSDRNPAVGKAALRKVEGIKQTLEKKEGLFRMNMMGKRVNFAARSVISPDPNIETNEVGVPPVFARKLTYPEPVTDHNFYELKQAVLNGPFKWPGAVAIENEFGQVVNLKRKNYEERQAIANQLLAPSSASVNGARNKKVHRHLTNGDIVLMNRQPTLHKPSIMAHRARVLPGEKTIRMHYANCNTYNADFDGDEMNMHFPQNEIARSEALLVADTDHQYLSATAGKPLRGLIQDHISVSVCLTNRDTFFDREDYHQLLCGCLRPEMNQTTSHKIHTVFPAFIKPKPLWTGKQIITTILRNITPLDHPGLTFDGKSQTPEDNWGPESHEGRIFFNNGYFVSGILDKAQLGPSGKGLIHSVYEAYGHTIAGRFLSILGKLLTKFLGMRAFSCGIDDLRLTDKGEEARLVKLKQARNVGLEVASKYVTLDQKTDVTELHSRLEDVLRDDSKQAGLDGVYNTKTSALSSEITSTCLPANLAKPFPCNQMQVMTASGAKGSNVNANLISCNLGQQILEGRRVPTMVSGKTLPSFMPFETDIRAGGYITDRFLTGVKPQAYFFHAMAGREGLIDTAVKTSRSGYLQRCLVKGMEGLKTEYDSSVRDSDGSVVQFLYGEDGLDVMKQKHLTDFKFLAQNHLSVLAELSTAAPHFDKLSDGRAEAYNKKAMRAFKKTGDANIMDPALALFNPGAVMGSVSESFTKKLKDYCEKNPENLLRDKGSNPNAPIGKKSFTALLNAKYMRSVIEPGEVVGVIAAQSVGEPSTQMTLNTFHLAGHAARNVTLGIPRLREIVMTASRSISTPTMTLHMISELTDEGGERFAKAISKLSMAEIIDNVVIHEKIGRGVAHKKARIYKIRFNLFPAKEYCETYAIKVQDVTRTIEKGLVPLISKAIKMEQERKQTIKNLQADSQPQVGKGIRIRDKARVAENQNLEDDEQDESDGDVDVDDAKTSRKRKDQEQATTYDEPDEGDAAARESKGQASPDVNEPEDEGIGTSPPESQADEDVESSDTERKQPQINGFADFEDRIKADNAAVSKFTFDKDNAEWCEIQYEYNVSTAKLLPLPLVEKACRNAIIQSIPNLEECTFVKEDDPVSGAKKSISVVLTKGVNLRAMHEYQDILNPHKIFTNDIAAVLDVYGVEACRATIVQEINAVFKLHGITVDLRHLNLIADVMTRGGGFTPFSRHGMKESISPFMKMSFETTMGFLRDAVLEDDWDNLNNPSARIVVGKLGKIGTGVFDVLTPLRMTT